MILQDRREASGSGPDREDAVICGSSIGAHSGIHGGCHGVVALRVLAAQFCNVMVDWALDHFARDVVTEFHDLFADIVEEGVA